MRDILFFIKISEINRAWYIFYARYEIFLFIQYRYNSELIIKTYEMKNFVYVLLLIIIQYLAVMIE